MAAVKLISSTRRSSAVVATPLVVMGAVGGYLVTGAEDDTPAASILISRA